MENNNITIEMLEEMRMELKKQHTIGYTISAIVGVVFLVLRLYQFIFFAIIFGIVITALVSSKNEHKYTAAFKSYFVVSSLQKYFTDLEYHPDQGMPYSTIANTKMMNMGDRYSSNDFISGKYKDIPFCQADVEIEEEHETTDSDGHTQTTYVTIFRGRWMIFDFNKPFKANIQVTEKGFGNSTIPRTLKKEQVYKKVAMESAEFNKKFKVYAQSEHEAFYILTPALMEKIERLEMNNRGKLLFCFINNKLHIGLYDGKDSFEHGSIYKPINEEEVRDTISQDIKTITQFVDELNLDNDLFRREV